MQEVTLNEILLARETRVCEQKELIAVHCCPLISFTMNIAGPQKNSPLIERAFYVGLKALQERLPKELVREQKVRICKTGCEAFFSVEMQAFELKEICMRIEESSPLGRLFDMDVLDVSGEKLERKAERGCIVCGGEGRGCAARRLHSVGELQAATHKMISEHFALLDKEKIAELAVLSLMSEVNTTPKPGLVDRRNCGSHRDMNVNMFIESAKALKPYFAQCVMIGQQTARKEPQETFLLLRKAGIQAEKVMFETTGGVNTHKGAIYSLGVLCGALGRLWKPQAPISDMERIFCECSEIVQKAVKSDFESMDRSTAGGRLYLEHGMKGIRGEVAAGFPSVKKIGMPAFEKALCCGLSANDAGAAALICLIANVQDTNLYHRGGAQGAAFAAAAAKTLLNEFPHISVEEIEKADDAFIERNLSPGGCADLLAVTYFIHSLKKQKTNGKPMV